MNLFDLAAKITLDTKDYEDKVKKSGDSAKGLGSKIGGAFSALGKVTLAGLGAAAAGVGTLVKSAVSSYADYEQLVGGVETLFSSLDGTVSAASEVMANAANAYKTAGMSANEYMETVTSFSAALVSSLEGDYSKAAKVSDMAITDMADNANKMGTSMESIQMAYQGFAKQNYTMLDNLKLGYGGTKQEMERLLADAEKFSGVHYDISNLSDVYEAIHVVQEELGIAGTTSSEAASTISGSTAMMKSAWANLVTGIADDNADFGSLIDNFVASVGTMAGNVMPRISKALSGVGKLVEGLAPQIANALPALIGDVLPSLLSAAATLLESFSTAILSNLPIIMDAAIPIIMTLANGIVQNLPLILKTGIEVILMIAEGIADSLPELIPTIVDVVLQIVDTLIDNVDQLVEAALQIIIALAGGLIQALPKLLEKAPEIIAALVSAIIGVASQLIQAAAEVIAQFAQGIKDKLDSVKEKGKEIFDNVKQGIRDKISDAAAWGKELIDNFISGIKNAWEWGKEKVGGVGNAIAKVFKHSVPREGPFKRDDLWGAHLIENFTDGMMKKAPSLIDKAYGIADSVGSAMRFNVSPSFGSTSTRSSDGGLAAEIAALREDVRNMKIYLDTGVLVGTVDSGFYERESGMMRRAFA